MAEGGKVKAGPPESPEPGTHVPGPQWLLRDGSARRPCLFRILILRRIPANGAPEPRASGLVLPAHFPDEEVEPGPTCSPHLLGDRGGMRHRIQRAAEPTHTMVGRGCEELGRFPQTPSGERGHFRGTRLSPLPQGKRASPREPRTADSTASTHGPPQAPPCGPSVRTGLRGDV